MGLQAKLLSLSSKLADEASPTAEEKQQHIALLGEVLQMLGARRLRCPMDGNPPERELA
jgi:hypothetical protein